MIGVISLAIVLFCSLAGALCYGAGSQGAVGAGRRLNFAAGAGAGVASVYLMVQILADNFGLSYVASYSSRDLPLVYKVSAFWAGQQGSFLLWLLIHGAAGAILACRQRMSNSGLAVYLALEALLTILVLAKSPFVPTEATVTDGIGMNPLLQDPWMAVHPPIIFLGYALLAIPFAYSLGALIRPEPAKGWLEKARQWSLLAWAFLGGGIFIGGYWAYKVLGWGGYWGWDPVENSSLVPWLLATVLVHVLRVARVRESAQSLVHMAAIFAYAFVLYGTFLTRSGILGDFSVHSFAESNVGLTIALVNAFVLLSGLLLLTWRAKAMPQGELYNAYGSREFLLLLGMLITVFIATIVFLGMSMPLLTQLAGKPAAVDTDFYVRTTLPLAITMMLVLGCACQRHFGGRVLALGKLPYLALVLGMAAALAAGVRQVLPVLLAGAAAMGTAASCRSFRLHGLGLGGAIAHAGLGLGLLAMVLAGSGSQQVSRELAVGEAQDIFGHEIVYQGQEFTGDGTAKYYKYTVDGREVAALTKLHLNGDDAAREPAIDKTLGGDVYLAPTPTRAARSGIRLEKGKSAMGNLFLYRLDGIDIREEGDKMRVTADIAVTDGERVEHARPSILATSEGGTSAPIEVMEGRERIRLTAVAGNQRSARLELMPSLQEEMALPVQTSISVKPVIWLLWLSAALVCAGCLVAVKK